MRDSKLKSFLVMQLRRASYKWPARNQALTKARIERGIYQCALCGPTIPYPKKEIRLDHIEPVVPITGWDTLDGYADRMFCEANGFQVLCNPHHDAKTQEENAARKAFKNAQLDISDQKPLKKKKKLDKKTKL